MLKYSSRILAIAFVAIFAWNALVVRADDRGPTSTASAPTTPYSEPRERERDAGYSWTNRNTRNSYGLAEAVRDSRSREAYANLKDQLMARLPKNAFVATGASFAHLPVGAVRAFVRVKFSGEELRGNSTHIHDPQDESRIEYDDEDDDDDDYDDDDDDGENDTGFLANRNPDFLGRRTLSRGARRDRRRRRRNDPLPPPHQCDLCIFKGLKDRMLQTVNTLKEFGSGLKAKPNATSFNDRITFTRKLRFRMVNDTLVGRGVVSFFGTVPEVMDALDRICITKYVYLKGIIMLPDTDSLSQDFHDKLRDSAKKLADDNAKALFKQFGYSKALNSTDIGEPIFRLSATLSPTVVTREWFYGLNSLKANETSSSHDRIAVINLNMLIQSRVRGLYSPVAE